MAKKKEVIEEVKEVEEIQTTKPVKEKKSPLVVILCIIIVLLVFVIGVLLGMNYIKDHNKEEVETKEEKKKDKEEKEEKEPDPEPEPEKPKKPKIDEEEVVSKAKSLVPNHMCGYPALPLSKKTIYLSDLDNDIKADMLLGIFHGNPKEDSPVTLDETKFSRYFEDLSFLDYLKKDSKNTYSLAPYILSYKDGKYIVSLMATGCEGAYEGPVLSYDTYEIDEDTLKLEYYFYYISYDYEEELFTFSKNQDSNIIYEGVDYESEKYTYNGKEISYDKFDKYIIYFDISDNNVRFQKMVYKEAK